MILQPFETFPIIRQLDNVLDETQYYVQAVVRDSKGKVLEKINLEDTGNQRFVGYYKVPNDPTGQGFYISITTSVYLDPDYTVLSPTYATEENTYLVQLRYNPLLGGGGGTSIVDSDTIRKILKEELPKPKDIDLSPIKEISKSISKLEKRISEIEDNKKEIEEKIVKIIKNEVLKTLEEKIKKIEEKQEKIKSDADYNNKVFREEIRLLVDNMVSEFESRIQKVNDSIEEYNKSQIEENKKLIKEIDRRFKDVVGKIVYEEPLLEKKEELLKSIEEFTEIIKNKSELKKEISIPEGLRRLLQSI